MKKEKREIYLALVNAVNYTLCTFCKYSTGGCDFCECAHPLSDISPDFEIQQDSAGEMGDCWGFRPLWSVSFTADVVGILLEHHWKVFSLWEEDGQWKIAGSKEV